MFEWTDMAPDREVQETEFKRLLGFPAVHVLEERPRELAAATRHWYAENGRPWIYARQVKAVDFAGDHLLIDGTSFYSAQLIESFQTAAVHSAIVVAVSAGRECETQALGLWQEGKPDEYFFLEMYGSAVVEHLVTAANGRICAWADQQGMVALPHYSPGYSGWDVSDQIKLWQLLRQFNGTSFPGELEVMDTGMLRPKKSLLAVIGLTREVERVKAAARLVPCENCALPGCQYRRVPYLHSLPQIEDVRRLQSGLRHGPQYSLNLKALTKWSRERLELKDRPNGTIEARFRYEGTTCSNLGRPLEFHYRVVLGPARDGHRILEAACAPAPGDTGHASQCEYLRDAAGLVNSIDAEKPLRGCPLDDVFAWARPYSPSGCYCDAGRRLHKWGLVYEVIHYALVQRERAGQ